MGWDKSTGMLIKNSGGNWGQGTVGMQIYYGPQEIFFHGFNGSHVMLGFNAGAIENDHYNTIDCAYSMDNLWVSTVENGENKGNLAEFSSDDLLSVAIDEEGVVTFKMDNQVLRTCEKQLAFPYWPLV
eukprot:TRINITY_DN4702_c0_g1_i1.p1 TRINITY_DN4702_c0_g1~~TRINITY_DN4702_c0_g1_i1.p1  ORF type:complete len:128 (+),score=31.84 TRINITY_DN4702_c0_g1_i1:387-770(+)